MPASATGRVPRTVPTTMAHKAAARERSTTRPCVQPQRSLTRTSTDGPSLPPEVRVTEIEEGKVLERDGLRVSAFLVEHDPVKPAYGYRFDAEGQSVVVSGDTRPCENLMRASRGVDVLVHECCEMSKTSWVPGCGWATIEEKIRDLASYHTQPEDIGRVAEGARPGRFILTHLMPGSDPAELKAAAEKYYRGPVTVADGGQAGMAEYAIAERESMVLKPTALHSGAGVIQGWLTSPGEWRHQVGAAGESADAAVLAVLAARRDGARIDLAHLRMIVLALQAAVGEIVVEPDQQAVHVDRLGIERLAPGEGKQPLGERGGALGAAHGAVDGAAQAFLRPPGPVLHVATGHLQIADDDREQIAEIVRDAAGELADRLHLLGLAQLLLQAPLLGDVQAGADDVARPAVGVAHRREPPGDPALAAGPHRQGRTGHHPAHPHNVVNLRCGDLSAPRRGGDDLPPRRDHVRFCRMRRCPLRGRQAQGEQRPGEAGICCRLRM